MVEEASGLLLVEQDLSLIGRLGDESVDLGRADRPIRRMTKRYRDRRRGDRNERKPWRIPRGDCQGFSRGKQDGRSSGGSATFTIGCIQRALKNIRTRTAPIAGIDLRPRSVGD